MVFLFFFFNDTATTEIYPLSLHDALPICQVFGAALLALGEVELDDFVRRIGFDQGDAGGQGAGAGRVVERSEEHTSELQSRQYLVCRLLLEKKKQCRATLASSTATTCFSD